MNSNSLDNKDFKKIEDTTREDAPLKLLSNIGRSEIYE